MSDTRAAEIATAIPLIEALGENVAWSFGTITSDAHAIPPYGKGVCVTISGPGLDVNPGLIAVFQKGHSFADATRRAIERYLRRLSGDRGA